MTAAVEVAVIVASEVGELSVNVKFDVNGTDADLKKWIRKAIRLEGGGNVQLAFGSK